MEEEKRSSTNSILSRSLDSLTARHPSSLQHILTLKELDTYIDLFLILIFPYLKSKLNKSLDFESPHLMWNSCIKTTWYNANCFSIYKKTIDSIWLSLPSLELYKFWKKEYWALHIKVGGRGKEVYLHVNINSLNMKIVLTGIQVQYDKNKLKKRLNMVNK